MNEMNELEALVSENEPEPAPNNSSLDVAKYVYHGAVLIIDGVTAYTVSMITIWYYGVIWFLANAVVFMIHHSNWERSENNDKQEKNSMVGMIVSVSTMFILAAASGGVLISGRTDTWIRVAIEIFAITAFFYHAISFAVYRFTDDKWKLDRQIAKARANANKKVQITEAAGKVIEANKRVLAKRGEQYTQHGRNVVDKALAKVEGRDFIPPDTGKVNVNINPVTNEPQYHSVGYKPMPVSEQEVEPILASGNGHGKPVNPTKAA